mgnify:CR=1 FL=1
MGDENAAGLPPDEGNEPVSGSGPHRTGDERNSDRSATPSPTGEPASLQGGAAGQHEDGAPVHALDAMPHRVSLPVVGEVPFWVLFTAAGVVVCAFFVVFWTLIAGLHSSPFELRQPSAGSTPRSAGDAANGEVRIGAEKDLNYEELMKRGNVAFGAEDYARAAGYYRAARRRGEESTARVLMARHWLSKALSLAGEEVEALRICDDLRALSSPGEPLWKHSLITSISLFSRQKRWKEFFQHLYLLRANTARYADRELLDRWLAYKRAMAHMELYLATAGDAGRLYDFATPRFGRADCLAQPLTEEDILVAAHGHSDGTLEVQFQTGELRLRSEGAPLGAVLDALRQKAELRVHAEGAVHYPVSAWLEAVAPESGLEMVLGSVGLETVLWNDRSEVGELSPRPDSIVEAVKTAQRSLQEFLILHPESANVAEAYYALIHLYAAQNQRRMALDQTRILVEGAPKSSWAVYGHYVAGREFCRAGEWERAEAELVAATDGPPDHPVLPSAFLWAGQCAVELGRHDRAVPRFRRALAYESNQTAAARLLYQIAFCLEKAGTSPREVEEQYLELRAHYPHSRYGRYADYRLGWLALETGRHRMAVERFESFLNKWSLNTEESPLACRDLVSAYLQCGYEVPALTLGEVMVEVYGYTESYWEVLPVLLEACRQGHLDEMALQVIDRALAHDPAPQLRAFLRLQQAEVLVDLGRYEEAQKTLYQLEQDAEGNVAREVLLCKARLLLARHPDEGVNLLCRLALDADSAPVQKRALKMLGEHYEKAGDFAKASRFYSGECPMPGKGGP